MGEVAHMTSLVKIGSEFLEYEDDDKPLETVGGISEEDAKELFHRFKELFDEAGIEFSLVYGSLLGAVRTGTFIPGDGDMDTYVWDEEKLRANLIPFYEKGLKLCRAYPGRLYTFRTNLTCRIDVYIYSELKGIMSWPYRSYCIGIMGCETPRKFFTGYQEITFLGEKCLCPKNPERLLEFWYGPDWRIPQNKKGVYSVQPAWFFRVVRDKLKFLRRACVAMFDKHNRQKVLWRKEKTGSFLRKH